jgi:pimeloyl-ACP methyl ester carboxylesterase
VSQHLVLPEVRTADLDGPVRYREWPGPPGPTFVCVHGLGGTHLNWLAVAPELSGRGRVIAIDLAGFGYTPRAGRSSGLPANRRLLSRFLGEVGVRR